MPAKKGFIPSIGDAIGMPIERAVEHAIPLFKLILKPILGIFGIYVVMALVFVGGMIAIGPGIEQLGTAGNPLSQLPPLAWVLFGIAFILFVVAMGLNAWMYLLMAKGGYQIVTKNKVDAEKAVKELKGRFWPSVGAYALVSLIVLGGTILFVAPGIILAVATFPAWWLVVLEKKPVGEAISQSFEMTRGRKGRLFVTMVIVSFIYYVVYAFASSLPQMVLAFEPSNPALMALFVILAIASFVVSIGVGFLYSFSQWIFGAWLYKQLKDNPPPKKA